jgi:hypothetical protein
MAWNHLTDERDFMMQVLGSTETDPETSHARKSCLTLLERRVARSIDAVACMHQFNRSGPTVFPTSHSNRKKKATRTTKLVDTTINLCIGSSIAFEQGSTVL